MVDINQNIVEILNESDLIETFDMEWLGVNFMLLTYSTVERAIELDNDFNVLSHSKPKKISLVLRKAEIQKIAAMAKYWGWV